MAASTRSSSIPRRRSWRSTIRSRSSVDVVAERARVMDEDLSAPGGDYAVPLEPGQEPRRRLARRAGQLCDLGLGGPDDDLTRCLTGVVRAAGLHLPEQRPRDPAGHGLERLAGNAVEIGRA